MRALLLLMLRIGICLGLSSSRNNSVPLEYFCTRLDYSGESSSEVNSLFIPHSTKPLKKATLYMLMEEPAIVTALTKRIRLVRCKHYLITLCTN